MRNTDGELLLKTSEKSEFACKCQIWSNTVQCSPGNIFPFEWPLPKGPVKHLEDAPKTRLMIIWSRCTGGHNGREWVLIHLLWKDCGTLPTSTSELVQTICAHFLLSTTGTFRRPFTDGPKTRTQLTPSFRIRLLGPLDTWGFKWHCRLVEVDRTLIAKWRRRLFRFRQGVWSTRGLRGKIYTRQVSEDPTIHDQVFKSHFSRLRGDTIIRRCNPPIRSSMNTSTHMDDETQSLCHKPLHCSNLARCLLWPPPSSSLSSSSSSFSSSQVSGGFLARTTSAEEVTHIRRHLLDHIAANICEHFL